MIFDRKLFSGKQTDLSVGFERAYEQFDMFERSRKVLDEMEKYDFEHERVIIFITDGRVQASEKQVKYEDTMKVSSSGLCGQEPSIPRTLVQGSQLRMVSLSLIVLFENPI